MNDKLQNDKHLFGCTGIKNQLRRLSLYSYLFMLLHVHQLRVCGVISFNMFLCYVVYNVWR